MNAAPVLAEVMPRIHGIRSFEGLRDRASAIDIAGVTLLVASLADIIKSKRAAGRPHDRAVLKVLEQAYAEAHETSGAKEANGRSGRAGARKRARRS